MFRHKGHTRSFAQNLRLAAFLSFTAGIVNICGLLALGILTTNVTGHFAYFSEGIQKRDLFYALSFLLYILAFLAGSFSSSMLIEFNIRVGKAAIPYSAIYLEILLLLFVALTGNQLLNAGYEQTSYACILLFAMGLQNSLVTRISNASVRTTHLTGLFTDLGIELSQLFFYKESAQKTKLRRSIGLRLIIVAFFFFGCLSGGFFYQYVRLKALLIACLVLVFATVYDRIRLGIYKQYKKSTTWLD